MDLADCVICSYSMNKGQIGVRLLCDPSHTFHKKCIEGWLNRTAKCPLCKADATAIEQPIKEIKLN